MDCTFTPVALYPFGLLWHIEGAKPLFCPTGRTHQIMRKSMPLLASFLFWRCLNTPATNDVTPDDSAALGHGPPAFLI